jgi:hypothetical protein
MRVSDERYSRDLRRLQLAWRMILQDARTSTIARWTHLSIYRIRRLRRHYSNHPAPASILKGSAPFRIEFFSKSATVRAEAPMLAGFLRCFGVLDGSTSDEWSLSQGERFCSAYELFRAYCYSPRSEISFEHSVLLLTELMRGEELTLAYCTCGELVVQDCLSVRKPLCASCLHDTYAGVPRFQAHTAVAEEKASDADAVTEGFQASLF